MSTKKNSATPVEDLSPNEQISIVKSNLRNLENLTFEQELTRELESIVNDERSKPAIEACEKEEKRLAGLGEAYLEVLKDLCGSTTGIELTEEEKAGLVANRLRSIQRGIYDLTISKRVSDRVKDKEAGERAVKMLERQEKIKDACVKVLARYNTAESADQ